MIMLWLLCCIIFLTWYTAASKDGKPDLNSQILPLRVLNKDSYAGATAEWNFSFSSHPSLETFSPEICLFIHKAASTD